MPPHFILCTIESTVHPDRDHGSRAAAVKHAASQYCAGSDLIRRKQCTTASIRRANREAINDADVIEIGKEFLQYAEKPCDDPSKRKSGDMHYSEQASKLEWRSTLTVAINRSLTVWLS